MAKNTLRDWSEPSYDVKTGRSASSIEEAGTGSKGNHTTRVSAQIDESRKGGQNGAPGTSALSKSGAADSGRNKWGGSDLP